MKAEIELNLDFCGRPCIKIRHHDKSNCLEQKLLNNFLELAGERGLKLVNTDSYLNRLRDESWKDYEIQIDND